MAPSHATVDSTLAKFRMPGPSCLTTCALAAVAIRHPTTVNSASLGISGCMPAPPFEGCSLPLRVSPPCTAPAADRRPKNRRMLWPADVAAQLSSDHSRVVAKGLVKLGTEGSLLVLTH